LRNMVVRDGKIKRVMSIIWIYEKPENIPKALEGMDVSFPCAVINYARDKRACTEVVSGNMIRVG